MISAHAVHSTARRSRCGAEIKILRRGPVRIGRKHGTSHKLPEVICPSSNISAYQVGIGMLQLFGIGGVAAEDKLTKARRESLHLRLDG